MICNAVNRIYCICAKRLLNVRSSLDVVVTVRSTFSGNNTTNSQPRAKTMTLRPLCCVSHNGNAAHVLAAMKIARG